MKLFVSCSRKGFFQQRPCEKKFSGSDDKPIAIACVTVLFLIHSVKSFSRIVVQKFWGEVSVLSLSLTNFIRTYYDWPVTSGMEKQRRHNKEHSSCVSRVLAGEPHGQYDLGGLGATGVSTCSSCWVVNNEITNRTLYKSL